MKKQTEKISQCFYNAADKIIAAAPDIAVLIDTFNTGLYYISNPNYKKYHPKLRDEDQWGLHSTIRNLLIPWLSAFLKEDQNIREVVAHCIEDLYKDVGDDSFQEHVALFKMGFCLSEISDGISCPSYLIEQHQATTVLLELSCCFTYRSAERDEEKENKNTLKQAA